MKTHLTYKAEGKETGAALCGNNGRAYKYGLPVVSVKEFRNVKAEDRCAHCVQIYITKRNAIRKAKGLPPVSYAFEGQECTP